MRYWLHVRVFDRGRRCRVCRYVAAEMELEADPDVPAWLK